jgi:hypothetical protein
MDAGHGKQLGDIVSKKGGSAAEDYYRYMLLKEKVKKEEADKLRIAFEALGATIDIS